MIPLETKLLNLLSNNDVTFFIPPYQRNYEWTDEQCKVFFDDIVKTRDRNEQDNVSEHFFGTVTYFQSETAFGQPNKLVLIDGQQRITTTMLLLVAVRDILEDTNLKNFIDTKYLKNNNVSGDGEYKIKLKQVETDWLSYVHIILGEELTEREKISAVYRNYQYFVNCLKEYQKKGNDILSLIDKGLDKFSIITIELKPTVNAWENPQEIFESMNSLGKPLSLADLVRNYLLLGLDANTQDFLYKKYWLHIEETLPGQVSNYIRDYMQWYAQMPFKKATESNYKELYNDFKNIFAKEKAENILQGLYEKSKLYSYILPNGKTGNGKIDYQLRDIQILRVTTAYSFLLAILVEWQQKRMTAEETAECLDAFRIYCMRRRLLGITSAENKNFPMLVLQIERITSAKDKREMMFEILAKQENNLRLPNDTEIIRVLETDNFYNFQFCKFFLALVEEKITKSRPDLSDPNLQIEHIMPQTLDDEWRKALGDNCDIIHQEYVHNIGNLTLIRHNQELGQKPFAEKKEVYLNKAGLQIARKKITDQDAWNEEAIKRRNAWISNFIVTEVLPIPDKMRRTNNFSLKERRSLSFSELQIIGEDIQFRPDPSISARVVSDNEVEFEGKRWKLSQLTRELQKRRGELSPSGSYRGAFYWEYDRIRLSDII